MSSISLSQVSHKLPAHSRRWRTRKLATSVLVWLAILFSVLWSLFPFYWAVITSLKERPALFGNNWLPFIQYEPTLRHWENLVRLPRLGDAMWNSIVIATASAFIATAFGVPAAYAIARCRFPNRWRLGAMLVFMVLRLMPPVALVTPYMLLTLQFGLRDTLQGFVLINSTLNLPLVLIIMSGVFLDVPGQLEEASWVDGSTRFGSFARILIPIVIPAVAASWVLSFAFSWNEAMFAGALSFREARSMPELIVATGGGGGVNFQAASTRSLTMMVFPVIAALFAQRYLVRGLSLGAVKG
jgi:multiple sugar transport system permease protein